MTSLVRLYLVAQRVTAGTDAAKGVHPERKPAESNGNPPLYFAKQTTDTEEEFNNKERNRLKCQFNNLSSLDCELYYNSVVDEIDACCSVYLFDEK